MRRSTTGSARERLIDFTAHSFHTEVRQEHSYFQLVDGRPGDWRFHRLFEGALHAQWLAGEAQRREGTQIVRRLLEDLRRFLEGEGRTRLDGSRCGVMAARDGDHCQTRAGVGVAAKRRVENAVAPSHGQLNSSAALLTAWD